MNFELAQVWEPTLSWLKLETINTTVTEHQSNQVRIADPFDNNATVKWRFSHM